MNLFKAVKGLVSKALEAREEARDLKEKYALACEAGIRDYSYISKQRGVVLAYAGAVHITTRDGAVWLCIGHSDLEPEGGYIDFKKVD